MITSSDGQLQIDFAGMRKALCVLDRESKIALCNASMAQFVGKSADEIVGLNCCLALRGNTKPLKGCPFAKMLESRQRQQVLLDADGRWLSETLDPLFDHKGDLCGAVHSVVEIANPAFAAESLVRVQRFESAAPAFRGIAHDLNNIFMIIGGALSLLKRGAAVLDQSGAILNGIETAIAQGQTLCQELLLFSKGENPTCSVIALDEIIKNTAVFALTGSRIETSFHLQSDLWSIHANAGQIRQLMTNLVTNAREAMPDDGVIAISAENVSGDEAAKLQLDPRGHIKIAVQDQGGGISPENMGKIFNPFFTTKEHGTGLGLATVDFIVTRHGGRVQVNSEPGAGATFTVYLPATDEESRPHCRRSDCCRF